MLKSLKLTNFKQHRDLSVEFTTGINVLRGKNEIGKSGVLHSIAYALFGIKAVPYSLEDAVTWGEAVNSLKVELDITVDGKVYHYKRSKAGAEVTLNGQVFCTGQNEVTGLSATLLGADAATASKLLLASQNGIRGALEEGPKALSLLIEELSDMAVFDSILEAAQVKLALGSPLLLEERLKGAESTLEAATQSLPDKPNEDAFRGEVAALNLHIATVERNIPALVEKCRETETAWQVASELYLKRRQLVANVEQAFSTFKSAETLAADLGQRAARKVDSEETLELLKQQLVEAERHADRLEAYRVYQSLPDGDRWLGDCDNFNATYSHFVDVDAEVRRNISSIESAIRELNRQRLDGGPCSKCGQPTAHLTHIAETNTKVDAELAKLEPALVALKKQGELNVARNKALADIQKLANALLPKLNKLGGYVTTHDSVYPPEVTWIGSVPTDQPTDAQALRKKIASIESDKKAKEADQARAAMAVEQMEAASTTYNVAESELNAFKAPDDDEILSLTKAKEQAILTLNASKGEILVAQKQIEDITKAHEQAKAMWSVCQSRVDDAQRVIAECKKDLESLSFNNALVKKLRAIRPMVANKLWNTVLSSVSVMFSQMRKEESWVTKEKDGFKVNGQSVESLSGSTLDILGNSIRIALLRTFLPNVDFMILDEPFSAMDRDRTEASLGALVSFGSEQTILITHEHISETICTNIIQL